MTILTKINRQSIRRDIRHKRAALSENEQQLAARKLQTKLSAYSQIKQAKSIAVYLANDGELDLFPFIDWCWQENKNVYLPVIHPFSPGNLLFLHYTKLTIMTTNKYGICEPKLDVRTLKHVNEIDVMCTPLVAFDDKGNRLGMGGGFYDRTLEQWYKTSTIQNLPVKPFPIGIAHDCQRVEFIPSEEWDIPLPQIITPQITLSP